MKKYLRQSWYETPACLFITSLLFSIILLAFMFAIASLGQLLNF